MTALDSERRTRIIRATHHLSDDSIRRKSIIKQLIADVRAEEAERIYRESTDNLHIAWLNVERALPKGWRHSITPFYPEGWEAEAHDLKSEDIGRGEHGSGAFFGPTPEMALGFLTAELRSRFPG